MKKQYVKGKLKLSKETLRSLSEKDLRDAALMAVGGSTRPFCITLSCECVEA